jgi:hypothetical protein
MTTATIPTVMPVKGYHASEVVTWNFTVPPPHKKSGKLQLLTIGGISVSGSWYGELGENFVAWSDLLKYDKDLFNATVEAYRSKKASEINTTEH